MPRVKIWSGDSEFDKNKSNFVYYFVSSLVGLLLFFLMWAVVKGGGFLFRLATEYWMHALGGLIAIVLITKFFSKKQLRVINK